LISIYEGDTKLLENVSTDLIVDSVTSYAPAYDKIARTIHHGEKLSIGVSDPAAASWLAVLARKYGKQRVDYQQLSYRNLLAQSWQVDIPNWVSEDEIQEAQLLDIHITPLLGQDFESFLLSTFFSPFLSTRELQLHRIEEMIQSFHPDQWQESKTRSLLKRILEKKLQSWKEKASQVGEQIIIEWLEDSPSKFIQRLSEFRLLSKYPESIGEKVFGEDLNDLKSLALPLDSIPSNENVALPFIDHIRIHLETLSREVSISALEDILTQVSGCLELEFDYVRGILRSGGVDVTPGIIQNVRNTFAPIKNRPLVEQALGDLDLLINKPIPSEPDVKWSEDEWISWATEEYFPYRFLLEETGRYSEDLELFIDRYSEWLYSNYASMRLTSKRMVYQKLAELRSDLQSSSTALVVILDNFNAKFFSDLNSRMNDEGFFTEGPDFCFSLLPSCTEISKKSLLVGEAQPFTGSDYGKIVEETWGEALGRKVRYLPNIGALRSLDSKDADVYFLNYLPVDIVLHLDEREIGISHAQLVRNCLSSLAKDVHAFSQRIGAERDLKVIFISDHGSTRIPSEAPNPLDQDYFRQIADKKHHRFIEIDDNELVKLPENFRHQCFLFRKEDFGLEAHYLAAKRLYRFLPTSSDSYFHGGLSPEETITPVAVFSPVSIAAKAILVN